jgi:hypothetical protein
MQPDSFIRTMHVDGHDVDVELFVLSTLNHLGLRSGDGFVVLFDLANAGDFLLKLLCHLGY